MTSDCSFWSTPETLEAGGSSLISEAFPGRASVVRHAHQTDTHPRQRRGPYAHIAAWVGGLASLVREAKALSPVGLLRYAL